MVRIIVLINLVLFVGVTEQRLPRSVAVFKQCPNRKALSTFENVRIYVINGKSFVDYDWKFSQEIATTKLMTNWKITRCSSQEALDSCQPISSIRTNDYCKMLTQKGEMWSGLTDCLTPRIQCPLQKITYRGKNCSIPDTPTMHFFIPFSKSYWKFTAEVWDLNQKNLVACSLFEGNFP